MQGSVTGKARGLALARSRRQFQLMVVAGMSAGKSTFLNALMGVELLPSANEATTACLTRIEHDRGRRGFAACAQGHGGDLVAREQRATSSTLRRWNQDPAVRTILASGSFPSHGQQASGLVLYDTPGPNNSQNVQHGESTREALRSVPARMLVHVLDAGQLGIADDHRCLELLRSHRRPGQRVFFLLNKMDLLDPERGESAARHVYEARNYLQQAGFAEPVVIPAMAASALYARMALRGESLTRLQGQRLQQALATTAEDEDELASAASVPPPLRERVRREIRALRAAGRCASAGATPSNRNALQLLVARSGIRMTELLVEQERELRAP